MDEGSAMAERHAWLRCGADFPREACDELLGRLRLSAVTVDPSTEGCVGPGALLFGTPSSSVREFLQNLQRWRASRAIAVAAYAKSLVGDAVWELLRSGADDVLAWDSCLEPAATITARLVRWLDIEELLKSNEVCERLRGRSHALVSVMRSAVEVARFSASPVLVTGDTGTGKELLARLIHDLDPRVPKRQFVVCDCTTITPELSGSEFFGHERGAFTGAVRAREGAFALADGGTLFLDEVGDLPPRMQAELLRVIQEGTYKRVGGNQWLHGEFRLVCATNRDLVAAMERGRFREDLYYRIAGCVLRMPSLEERREDIVPLIEAFLAEVLGADAVLDLDATVRDYLLAREYPGNVRELRQLVLHMAQRFVPPGPITLGALPESEIAAAIGHRIRWPHASCEQAVRTALAQGRSLAELRSVVSQTAYRLVLAEVDGDTLRAAERLHVSQRAVQQFLREHGDFEQTSSQTDSARQPDCTTNSSHHGAWVKRRQ